MKKPLILTCICLSLLAPSLVQAHPETGLLPDAIAETEYRIVLEINPRDVQTRTRLAVVLCRKNKLKEAERELNEVLKVAPNDFDAHDAMGLVRLKEKKALEAIAWFQKAIAINSEDTMVHHALGQAMELAGRPAEAEASYRRGLAVNDRLLRKGANKDKEMERKSLLLAALQNLQSKARNGR